METPVPFLSAPDSKFGAHRYEERVSVHLTSIRRVFPRFQSFGVAQPLVLHQKYRVTKIRLIIRK